jgi:hypothetical protein
MNVAIVTVSAIGHGLIGYLGAEADADGPPAGAALT